MLQDIFATKIGMTQAWTKSGKRLAVTRCAADNNMIVGVQHATVKNGDQDQQISIFELGYGSKKLKNVAKPLRARLQKSGFSVGPTGIVGTRAAESNADSNSPEVTVGITLSALDVLQVGDVVKVQGVTKGRGFAGGMKRHGFHGGPKTHGQSDRSRAVGSIGAGTSPGKVWKGKKMPGRYGQDTQTVKGLVVVHVDKDLKEIWLSGPVPGVVFSNVKITKTGTQKSIELDSNASGIKLPVVAREVAEVEEVPEVEVTSEVAEDVATEAGAQS
ncbi:MAG: 50S ribosomal protein L3 [Microgenomates group bacterium]